MIVRVWKARVTPENAPLYREHLRSHVLPTLQSLSGFIDATLMERDTGEDVELIVSSRWDSLRAVRQFAGDAYEKAVVAPGARAVLSSFDEEVAHYELTVECKA
jgi:heme-degrading monooxygenase HmoA